MRMEMNILSGKNMNKVPNLRFSSFNDEWQEHVLGDIFEFYTTNSFSRDFLDNDKGSVKNIHYGDIHMKFPTILDVKNKQIPYVKEPVDLSKISIEAYCKNGDVVIADASEDYNDIGKAIELKNVGEEKLLAGLHTILARDNKQVMVNGFRGYLMSSPNVRKQIKVYAAGAKVLGISKSNISKVSLLIPSSMEQEKIASFFSLIDKKIELQTEKVEELKNYKKGIMQKIFSQELRFKDENGNEYPEWEEKSFQELYLNIPTKPYQIKSSDVKAYGELEVVDQGKEKICGYTDNHDKIFDNLPIIIYGDHTTNIKFRDEKFVIGADGTKLLRNKNTNNDLKFLFYALEFNNIEAEGYKRHFSILKQISLYIPESLSEQVKISKVLSYLDIKIDKEQEKLESLNQYKTGLLQQMFI